jgi:hypothetical protein
MRGLDVGIEREHIRLLCDVADELDDLVNSGHSVI